jgi:hypothetical protein
MDGHRRERRRAERVSYPSRSEIEPRRHPGLSERIFGGEPSKLFESRAPRDARHNAVLALKVIMSAWPTPDEEQIKTAIASVVSWINALRAHQ